MCCVSIGLRCPQASWLPNISLPHLGPPWNQSSPSPTVPGSSCCQRPHCPSGVTNLLPFCFCHPKLVVAQEEGPHGFADLWLDAPVVDETQQLLLLVTLWKVGGNKGFGQQETGDGLCDPAVPLLRPSPQWSCCEQAKPHGPRYPSRHHTIKQNPRNPHNCPPMGECCIPMWEYHTESNRPAGAFMRTYIKGRSVYVVKCKK